jgi:hypothetical protein
MWSEFLARYVRAVPATDRADLRMQTYAPLPQRLIGNDATNYRQAIPPASGNFLTFWDGNQLPGSFMHLTAHTQYLVYRTQDFVQPQYNTQASFGSNLSQIPAAQLLANWRTMWASASGRYGNG